jgi:nitrogen fixation NifU-like protein
MQDPLYREIILEHWQHPQNYGVVKDADIDMTDSNPLCGDEIRVTVKITDGKVKEIKFSGEGCAISKASASIFTEKIKGAKIAIIKKITPEEVLEALDLELTPARMKCGLLIYQTTQKAFK